VENNERGNQIDRAEVWIIAFAVTLSVWLVTLVAVALCWDRLCAKITINALEYGAKQVLAPRYSHRSMPARSRKVSSYQPNPPRHRTLDEQLEEFKADLERVAPTETLEETLERIDREARDVDSVWLRPSDANE